MGASTPQNFLCDNMTAKRKGPARFEKRREKRDAGRRFFWSFSLGEQRKGHEKEIIWNSIHACHPLKTPQLILKKEPGGFFPAPEIIDPPMLAGMEGRFPAVGLRCPIFF